jgi:Flp pilus assembly protein TadD
VLHSLHRDDESETVFKRAASLAPNDARPINSLAILAMEHRRPAEALNYFRASLQIAPKDPDIWRSMGFLLQKGSKLADAAQAFRTATDLNPGDVASWRQLGVIDYAGNLTGVAISDLQHAVKLDPSNVETLDLLGDDALAIGNVPIARTAYEQAAKLDANDTVAKLGLARVGLQLDPSPADLQRIGGQIDSILAAKPTAAAYLARGQCDLLRRRNTGAVNELKRALKLDPHLITAHTFLSRAYSALGKAPEARAEALIYATAGARTTSLSGTEAK